MLRDQAVPVDAVRKHTVRKSHSTETHCAKMLLNLVSRESAVEHNLLWSLQPVVDDVIKVLMFIDESRSHIKQ